MLCPAQRGVQREGTCVGEAVQHRFPCGQTAHRPAVVLLIQKETGFLPVFHVHQISDPVFHNLHHRAVRRRFAGEGVPPLALGQTFLVPEGHIVPQEHAPDGLAVLPENVHQSGQQEILQALHPHGQHLHAEEVVELVHRQAGEGVGFPEDDAAGVQIRRGHNGLPIRPRPLQLPPPESRVKAVVGIPGNEPHPDLGLLGEEAGAEIAALFADHIHQTAVAGFTLRIQNLRIVHPRMSPQNGGLRLGRYGVNGIAPLHFHKLRSFELFIRDSIARFCRKRHTMGQTEFAWEGILCPLSI